MTLPVARVEPRTTADHLAILRSRSAWLRSVRLRRVAGIVGLVALSLGIAIATLQGCIGKASRVRDPRTVHLQDEPTSSP